MDKGDRSIPRYRNEYQGRLNASRGESMTSYISQNFLFAKTRLDELRWLKHDRPKANKKSSAVA